MLRQTVAALNDVATFRVQTSRRLAGKVATFRVQKSRRLTGKVATFRVQTSRRLTGKGATFRVQTLRRLTFKRRGGLRLKNVGVVVRFLFENKRKFDDEARAAERRIVDDNFSLVFADDFLRYREAETGAAAFVFRRERAENRVAARGRDAGADVVDDNENAL